MGQSIAAKYAARPAARFVRPSSRLRERRLGLGAIASFSAAVRRTTELRAAEGSPLARLRAGWRGPTAARPVARSGRPRPAVQMQWARSGRSGPGRRPSAATAPWHA
ncbi:MAG TPA: hypothetical protein VD763_07425 [Candidatus Saccharimonadales bacterium]|nr:hypothetical protein [Candidatus Saccharimonadales bacterium]